MADAILTSMFNVIGGSVLGNSMVFAIFVFAILIIMLLVMRLPVNITLAFVFPVILAFCLFGYFPIWFKAISSLVVGIIWFFIIRGLVFNE